MAQCVALITSSASIREPEASAQREIAELVRVKLARSPYRWLRSLSCAVRDGVLTLGGQVPTYYLKQMAQTVVRDVPGVDEINNEVEVVPPGPQRVPLDGLVTMDQQNFRKPR
jgi:osmotically-inducible protein OsmY